MKKEVKSWEFWVVVAISIALVWMLYQAYLAAQSLINGGENLLNDAENLPGSIAGAAGAAAGGFVAWLQGLFTSSSSTPSAGGDDYSQSGGN